MNSDGGDRQPKTSRALDVQPPNQHATKGESEVGWHENGACRRGRPATNSDSIYGCVEKDHPARGHDAELSNAGEKCTA